MEIDKSCKYYFLQNAPASFSCFSVFPSVSATLSIAVHLLPSHLFSLGNFISIPVFLYSISSLALFFTLSLSLCLFTCILPPVFQPLSLTVLFPHTIKLTLSFSVSLPPSLHVTTHFIIDMFFCVTKHNGVIQGPCSR